MLCGRYSHGDVRRPYPQLLLHGFNVQKGALGVGDGYAAPVAESAAVYGLHRVSFAGRVVSVAMSGA